MNGILNVLYWRMDCLKATFTTSILSCYTFLLRLILVQKYCICLNNSNLVYLSMFEVVKNTSPRHNSPGSPCQVSLQLLVKFVCFVALSSYLIDLIQS